MLTRATPFYQIGMYEPEDYVNPNEDWTESFRQIDEAYGTVQPQIENIKAVIDNANEAIPQMDEHIKQIGIDTSAQSTIWDGLGNQLSQLETVLDSVQNDLDDTLEHLDATDTLLGQIQTVLTQVSTMNGAQATEIADLENRVAALE